MERKDIASSYGPREPRHDRVSFDGSGREAELLVTGLRALAAQIAIRDVTTEASNGYFYPHGSRHQGDGVPLAGEIATLLAQIENPNFVEAETASETPKPVVSS